jgi:hypothetical protein
MSPLQIAAISSAVMNERIMAKKMAEIVTTRISRNVIRNLSGLMAGLSIGTGSPVMRRAPGRPEIRRDHPGHLSDPGSIIG